MELQLSCECGRAITVTEGSADVVIQCACGRTLRVPPFRKPPARLAQGFDAPSKDAESPELQAILIVGMIVVGNIVLGGALLSFASGGLGMIGYTVALGSQVWLIFLIVSECHPEAIVWTLLIPFFTWYFAYQRWDIAKWAFLCNVAGLLLFLAALIGIV